MTDEKSQPSVEEMQTKLAELSKTVEQQKLELDSFKEKYTKSEKSLSEQRELNSKLLLQVPSLSTTEQQSVQDEEDTVESIIEDVVRTKNQELIGVYRNDKH